MMPRARLGKIARLPAEVRREVNLRLADNQPAAKILAWLNAMPSVKAIMQTDFDGAVINPQNLSEWRAGGYQDFLREREEVDKIKTLAQFSMDLAQGAGDQMAQGPAAIAAGKLLTMLETAPEEDLGKIVAAITSLRGIEIAAIEAKTKQAKLAQTDRSLALAEERFRRQTCELFLKWRDDQRAIDVADGKGTKDFKIGQLRDLMFGPAEA
jgi:hypothetical protein